MKRQGMKQRRADIARFLHLASTLTRHGAGWWLARGKGDGSQRLRAMLEAMGGSFVKLGQMLALQPDIVPPGYCRALQDLLDRMPPVDFADVQETIEREAGRPIDEIFDRLEREPLATASIAQVHVAWIAGRKLAVKVQRPGAEREFGSDIRLVERTMRWIRRLRLRGLYWLLEPLGEFVNWTAEELDFRCEARYAEQLAQLAEGHAIQRVPSPWPGLVSRRLLVVDFLEGSMLLNYLRALEGESSSDAPAALPDELEPKGFDRRRFAANIVDNFLRDAFENGIYHADLHPANLMMLEDSVVGYVDFGITGVLSRYGRRQLMAMTLALSTGDMELFHRCFRELTVPDPRARPDLFRRGLDRLAASWYGPQGELRVNFTRIMVDMLALSREAHFLPERDIVKYIRSSIAIDGLITRFAPDFDVGGYLAERCATHMAAARRRDQLALPRLLEWGSTTSRLLTDGPQRLEQLVETLESEDIPSTPPGHANGDRGLVLGVSMLAVAGLSVLAPPELAAPGFNLWTAQMLFLAASAMGLALIAWRGTHEFARR